MRKLVVALGVIIIAIGALAIFVVRGDVEYQGDRVRFQLQWFDQAQFVGFYVAQEKGYFRDAGLDVTIQPGGYGTRPMELLEGNQADIAVAPMDTALHAIAMGRPATIIGAVFDRSMVCFMSRREAQIRTPHDLVGKIVGVYTGFDTENILNLMLLRSRVDRTRVDIRPAGQIAAFESGDFDVWPSYRFNEPLLQQARGTPVDCLKPEDFGISYYSDTLVVSDQFANQNPDVVRRFLGAAAKGWQFALDNPSEALKSMYELSNLNLGTDGPSRAHQMAMLSETLNYVDRSGDPLFSISRQNLHRMIQDMERGGLLPVEAEKRIRPKVRHDLLEGR